MSSLTPHAKAILDRLRTDKANQKCIDCSSRLSVDWASVNLGVFFCIDCSGKHRSLGVHISFVRSLTMDKWDDKQLAFMQAGGNKACKDFLEKHDCFDLGFAERWKSKGADKWRKKLTADVAEMASRKKKSRKSSSSESDSSTESDSEPEPPKVTKPKPPVKPKSQPVVQDLLDFSCEAPSPVAESPKAVKKTDSHESRKDKSKDSSKVSKESSRDKAHDDFASNPSLDKGAVEERIKRRTEAKDRQRTADALSKLEAMCGGAGDEPRCDAVNPPGQADSDSDSDEAAARRARRARRRKDKERERDAGREARGEGGDAPGNPAPRSENTMQRLRREAEEAKQRRLREKQEHMAKFAGQTSISSEDFFGDGSGGRGGGPVEDREGLAHVILHKGLLSRDTLSLAKDRALEAVPDMANRAGTAVAAAASYLGVSATGWLSVAKERVGMGTASMSSVSGSWIDEQARRRAEIERSLARSGASSASAARPSFQGFGSDNVGGMGGMGGAAGLTRGVEGLGLGKDREDLERWLDDDEGPASRSKKGPKRGDDSGSDSSDDEAQRRRSKASKSSKKKKSSKKSRKVSSSDSESDSDSPPPAPKAKSSSSSSKGSKAPAAQKAPEPAANYNLVDLLS